MEGFVTRPSISKHGRSFARLSLCYFRPLWFGKSYFWAKFARLVYRLLFLIIESAAWRKTYGKPRRNRRTEDDRCLGYFAGGGSGNTRDLMARKEERANRKIINIELRTRRAPTCEFLICQILNRKTRVVALKCFLRARARPPSTFLLKSETFVRSPSSPPPVVNPSTRRGINYSTFRGLQAQVYGIVERTAGNAVPNMKRGQLGILRFALKMHKSRHSKCEHK